MIFQGDTFEWMSKFAPGVFDMVLCDLPYGVTSRNEWDSPLPVEPLWSQYRRLLKPDGVVVLFGQGVFSVDIINGARDWYRYTLIWRKNKPRGHLNAKKRPMSVHEDILVFYPQQPTYNPQKTEGHKPINYAVTKHTSPNYGAGRPTTNQHGATDRYPQSVLDFDVVNNDDPSRVHPTQKPVPLGRWLVRTYTNPGDVVLDNTCGSGALLRAAVEEGRRAVGIEMDPKMAAHAQKWVGGVVAQREAA